MKSRVFTAMLMAAAILAASGASAQQYSYSYSYDAHPYGGVSTITSLNGRGGVSSRAIIHGPSRGGVVITHPNGSLTTGAVDQFGSWYTITTPGNAYRYPRPLR